MIIDCDSCEVRSLACDDCVVSALLGGPPGEIDDGEAAALEALAGVRAGAAAAAGGAGRGAPAPAAPAPGRGRLSGDGLRISWSSGQWMSMGTARSMR